MKYPRLRWSLMWNYHPRSRKCSDFNTMAFDRHLTDVNRNFSVSGVEQVSHKTIVYIFPF